MVQCLGQQFPLSETDISHLGWLQVFHSLPQESHSGVEGVDLVPQQIDGGKKEWQSRHLCCFWTV